MSEPDSNWEEAAKILETEANSATQALCDAIRDTCAPDQAVRLLSLLEVGMSKLAASAVAETIKTARRALNAERAYRDLISAPRPIGRFASRTQDERIQKAREFRDRMAKEIGL